MSQNQVVATTVIDAPVEEVRRVLLDAAALADWNPAFLSIGPARADGSHPIRVKGGLPGSFRYLRTDPERLESTWRVPGLEETNYWILSPQGGRTRVEHGFGHQGALARVMRNAFSTAGELRLQRLTARVEGRTG